MQTSSRVLSTTWRCYGSEFPKIALLAPLIMQPIEYS